MASPAWGATYTVCASGCSETTIQAVFDNNDLGANDIVEIAAGTYNEDVSVVTADSGTSSGRVTLKAASGATVNIKSLHLTNVSYFDIQNLIFTGAAADGFWISSTEGNNIEITLSDCQSNANGRHGFYIEDDGIARTVDKVIFERCTALNNNSGGFHIYSTANPTVFGSDGVLYDTCISDGSGQTIDHHGFSAHGRVKNLTYRNCIARNTNLVSAEGHGFVADDYVSNVMYLHCSAYSNDGHGFVVSHQDENGEGEYNSVIYSLAYNNLRGITVNGAAGGASNIRIWNNTIAGNTEAGITLNATINSAAITNNIIANNGTYGITADEAGVTATASYNLIYGSGTAALNNITNSNGSTSDPILNAVYGIAGNSPAKDAGAVLYTYAAYPGDYLGHKIYGSGPDIGAVEYEDHTPGGWFFEFFMPTIMKLCASTNAACYTQP